MNMKKCPFHIHLSAVTHRALAILQKSKPWQVDLQEAARCLAVLLSGWGGAGRDQQSQMFPEMALHLCIRANCAEHALQERCDRGKGT